MNDVKRTNKQALNALLIVIIVGLLFLVSLSFVAQGSGDDPSSEDDMDTTWGGTVCCGLYIATVIVGIFVAVWVYKDAEARQDEGWAYALMVVAASIFIPFIGFAVGIVAWLIVRPDWDAISRPGMGRPAPMPRYQQYPGAPPAYQQPAPPQQVRRPPPSSPSPPCPRCGTAATYSDEYDDYYCWECQNYFHDMM